MITFCTESFIRRTECFNHLVNAFLHHIVGSVAEQELCDKLFYPKGETIIIWCAGWDDEDPDDEFLEHLQRELEAFKTAYASRTAQTRKAA